MLNISKFDQKKLFKQSQLKKLQDNSYLQDADNENFQYIKEKFFNTETDEKAKLLNLGSGLFSSISSTIAYYVGTPTVEFSIEIEDYVKDYVSLGFATIGLAKDNTGTITTEYQPAKNYWNDNGIDKILRLYVKDEGNTSSLYMLVSEYGIGYIENKLYKLNQSDYTSDEEVDLKTLPQTEDILPRIETGLTIPALLIVGNSNSTTSLIEKIKPLVYAIDRQIVMQHTQFLQNVESFVLFKGVRRPQKILTEYNAGKKIDFSMIGRLVNGDDTSSIEFINNTNSLIETSMQDNKDNIMRVSAITDVPTDFLGLESNDGAIGENSRALKQGAFIKRIVGIRGLFDKAIEIIIDAGKYEEGYTRPDVLAKSDNELVEELKIAREINIISQLEAIKKYNGLDDDEAEEMLLEINKESLSDNKTNESNTNGFKTTKGDKEIIKQ